MEQKDKRNLSADVSKKEAANLDNDKVHWDSFITLKRWLENRNANKTFAEYFREYGYGKIAIYGAGDIGKLLYEEIKNSEIVISYYIDRNAEGLKRLESIPVIPISDIKNMEEVDAIVITPLGNYDAICRSLAETAPEMRTISLREAVYEF